MLSITTIYAADSGDPFPYLRRIADAGFTHVLWSHHGYDDFTYTPDDIAQVHTWLSAYNLSLLDIHGSCGVERVWCSPREEQRQAGVKLVESRIELAARLSARVVIMHTGQPDPRDPQPYWTAIYRSLDELEPFARARGVRIALENGTWAVIRPLLNSYEPDFVGLCYDSGHGNLSAEAGLLIEAAEPPGIRLGAGYYVGDGGGLGGLELLRDRLIAVHLHDNDGRNDLHDPLFSGTVDWSRLARIVATSSYAGPVSMETVMSDPGLTNEADFLARVFATGTRFARMIEAQCRQAA
jgi:sugar phosphate isomerase/epimerase